MGYTHYWNWDPATPWNEARQAGVERALMDMIKIVRHGTKAGLLCGPMGDGKPALDHDARAPRAIGFNGCGDDAHETFSFPTGWSGGLGSFTKTARKPYDAYVVACLLAARAHIPLRILSIGSDGDAADWEAGAKLYRTVLKKQPPSLAFLDR